MLVSLFVLFLRRGEGEFSVARVDDLFGEVIGFSSGFGSNVTHFVFKLAEFEVHGFDFDIVISLKGLNVDFEFVDFSVFDFLSFNEKD